MKTIFIIKYNDFSATVKEEYKTKKEANIREQELYKMGRLKK